MSWHSITLKVYAMTHDEAKAKAMPLLIERLAGQVEVIDEENLSINITADIYTDHPAARGRPSLANYVATVTYAWEA